MDADELESLTAIERRIKTSPNPYRAVACLAGNIRSRILGESNREDLKARFDKVVAEHALEEAPAMIARYARKLLLANVTAFEEVSLVFSLLEEIEAMKELGLELADEKQAELKSEFWNWLNRNRDCVRTILQACRESEFAGSWFYQAALE